MHLQRPSECLEFFALGVIVVVDDTAQVLPQKPHGLCAQRSMRGTHAQPAIDADVQGICRVVTNLFPAPPRQSRPNKTTGLPRVCV